MVNVTVHVSTSVSRERGDDGRYIETVTPDDVLAVLREANEPLTGTEVGEQLDISSRSALDKLNELHERGDVERKQVGARSVVWWLAEAETAVAEFAPDDPLFTGDALFASEEPLDETEIDDILYGEADG